MLEGIAEELDRIDDELAAELREAVEGLSYYDLSEFDAARFRSFLEAAERSYSRAMAEWSDSIVGPTPALMFVFSQLKALLRTDERAGKRKEVAGRITIQNEVEWRVPWWVNDMALEHMAAQVRLRDEAFAEDLLAARTSEGNTRYDVSALDGERFRALLPAAEWMRIRYGDQKARDAYAPAFFSEVAPRVVQLDRLLRAAARVTEEPA